MALTAAEISDARLLLVGKREGAGHVHVAAPLGSITFLFENRRDARHFRQAFVLRHNAHEIPAALRKAVAADVDDEFGQFLIVDLGIGNQSPHGRILHDQNQELEHVTPLLDIALLPGLLECRQPVWTGNVEEWSAIFQPLIFCLLNK